MAAVQRRIDAKGSSRRAAAADSVRPTASNRREHAYGQLKADIVEGRLAPGAPLTEIDLATRLGVSRTPVREALQRLAVEGLVSWVPGRGASVSALSVPDIVELFQLREALESYTARLAARSEGHPAIGRFLGPLEESRSLVSTGNIASTNRLTSLTDDFDRAVCELAGNRRLRTTLDDVWAQSVRIRRLAYRKVSRVLESIDEHMRIVRAIEAGQEDAAAAAAADHIRRSLLNVIESLASGSLAQRD